ncbi:hypothetical protein PJI17_11035 [Mycobacterium kansasii]
MATSLPAGTVRGGATRRFARRATSCRGGGFPAAQVSRSLV